MRILAIETSCDESAIAVLDEQQGLLSHELWSQVELHRAFGGVVPELASRDHVRRLVPLLRASLEHAQTEPAQIHGIAYTAGPGLTGALLTGAAFAHALSLGWGVPVLGVHHLEAHLLAPLLEEPSPPLPHVALLVSGGHTMLVDVRGIGEYRILGATRDDAAGEAFDKTAKLLGLPYPGGPELARLAQDGRAGAYRFPRPMLDRPGLEFSFSGLKTAVCRRCVPRRCPRRPARRCRAGGRGRHRRHAGREGAAGPRVHGLRIPGGGRRRRCQSNAAHPPRAAGRHDGVHTIIRGSSSAPTMRRWSRWPVCTGCVPASTRDRVSRCARAGRSNSCGSRVAPA